MQDPTSDRGGRPAAIIRDRRHNLTYVASWAECGERSITFRGRLRHVDVRGVRLYRERMRTLPLTSVEIEWLIDVAA